jgi:putative SOS response-associated peptidase YedK
MPLVLPARRWADWLDADPATDGLLAPPPAEFLAGLEIRPVGAAVGDVRNDGPALVERVAAEPLIGEAVKPIDLTLF